MVYDGNIELYKNKNKKKIKILMKFYKYIVSYFLRDDQRDRRIINIILWSQPLSRVVYLFLFNRFEDDDGVFIMLSITHNIIKQKLYKYLIHYIIILYRYYIRHIKNSQKGIRTTYCESNERPCRRYVTQGVPSWIKRQTCFTT